jgi:TrmH family RNA methyltransferase
VDALITTGHGIDPYDPAVIRASLGAIFHTHIIHAASATLFEEWVAHVREVVPGVQMVGTRAEAPLSVFEMEITPPLILVGK